MEFGKLADIENVNWDLPPDPPGNSSFLSQFHGDAEYLLGTPAWGHKEWIGVIYPPGTKSSQFLYFYSRHYQTIELNTSHYRIPTADQSQKWLSQVPEGFLFCPKVFQGISHAPGGLQDVDLLRTWFTFLQNLKAHRGPCFLQLPPNFDYSQKSLLHHFLKRWPSEFDLALEFRHPSWFQSGQIIPLLAEYLQARRIGLVITDVAGRRDVLHSTVSAPFAMLRFIGNDLHPSDTTRFIEWSQKLKTWSKQGLRQMFVFVHEPDDVRAPQMTEIAIRHLNAIAEAGLPERPLLKSSDAAQELSLFS